MRLLQNKVVTDVLTQLALYDNDLGALEQVLNTVLAEYDIVNRSTALATKDCSWQILLMRFLEYKTSEGRSVNTLKQYKFLLKHMLEKINKPVNQILEQDVFDYLCYKRMEGNSNTYLETLRIVGNGFFEWLVEKQYLDHNPMAGLHRVKIPKVIKKPFTDLELETMRLALVTPRDKAMFEVLYSSGVRVSELVNMKISDINFNERSAIVLGKGNKEREVYFSSLACIQLQRYLETRKDSFDILFLSQRRKGQAIQKSGVEGWLHKLGEAAHIDNVHPHRFRRTLATNLMKKGMRVEEVQMLLGHDNISTTMMYCQVQQEAVKHNHRRYSVS